MRKKKNFSKSTVNALTVIPEGICQAPDKNGEARSFSLDILKAC